MRFNPESFRVSLSDFAKQSNIIYGDDHVFLRNIKCGHKKTKLYEFVFRNETLKMSVEYTYEDYFSLCKIVYDVMKELNYVQDVTYIEENIVFIKR